MSTSYERLDATDIADQASQLEQMQLDIALRNRENHKTTLKPKLAEVTNKKKNTTQTVCLCHYCDEILCDVTDKKDPEELPRCCDHECRDEWQKEMNLKIRTGQIRGDYRQIPGLGGRTGVES